MNMDMNKSRTPKDQSMMDKQAHECISSLEQQRKIATDKTPNNKELLVALHEAQDLIRILIQ